MGACQIPNGCIHDGAANACPLCDEHGADDIAEHYAAGERLDAIEPTAPIFPRSTYIAPDTDAA